MWVPRPTAPATGCSVCKHGADQGVGPFWQGPKVPTGRPGFGARQTAHVHVCRECMFVIVNHPESPFHGLIPAGEAAKATAESAERMRSHLTGVIDELRDAKPADPEEIAKAAVAAAIAELEERGAFDKPEAPKPPARKQAAKSKAA